MSRLKKSAKRKARGKVVPISGVAGLTFLAGAPAPPAHPSLVETTDGRGSKMLLGEEEISDVSLATFYAVDREGQGGARHARVAIAGAAGCGCGCGGCCASCGPPIPLDPADVAARLYSAAGLGRRVGQAGAKISAHSLLS
jgi:hypothetical protein